MERHTPEGRGTESEENFGQEVIATDSAAETDKETRFEQSAKETVKPPKELPCTEPTVALVRPGQREIVRFPLCKESSDIAANWLQSLMATEEPPSKTGSPVKELSEIELIFEQLLIVNRPIMKEGSDTATRLGQEEIVTTPSCRERSEIEVKFEQSLIE